LISVFEKLLLTAHMVVGVADAKAVEPGYLLELMKKLCTRPGNEKLKVKLERSESNSNHRVL